MDKDEELRDAGKAAEKVGYWLREVAEACKREKGWRESARKLVQVYECDDPKKHQFNILYSNTETLLPAIFNASPRPVVQRRYKDEDPTGAAAAKVTQRVLEYLLDNELNSNSPFDDIVSQAVLEALVTGRGAVWYRYDAEISSYDREKVPAEGEVGEVETVEEVRFESVVGELVPWDRFLHGYAKQWRSVPWVSREHFMTRDELRENFKELAERVELTANSQETSQDAEGRASHLDEKLCDLAQVYEIWDKETKKVYFVSPGYKEGFLRELEDPLGLVNFFPIPSPLGFFRKVSTLVPVPLYMAYKEQAEELNRVSVRINKLVDALKVRGVYDGQIGELERVMSAEDNTFVPAENAAILNGGSIDKALWMMPLGEIITTLQSLYQQRNQVKEVIYEISGISDIIRGAGTAASESATAQNLKSQWGTLRLKRLQKRVQTFVRENLRIMAEISCAKFSVSTLEDMTGLGFPTEAQKMQGQQLMQAISQAQAAGQQVPPPPPELLSLLQQPSWEEIEALLSDRLLRNFRIDVESNSTVDAEATEDKQNMGEFLNAVAQFMNGVAPLVMQGVLPFDAAKAILLAVTRRYRFGPEVEDMLNQMQAPEPSEGEGDSNDKAKQELELRKLQIEVESKEREAQIRQEEFMLEAQLKQAEAQAKLVEIQAKSEAGARAHQMKMAQMMVTSQLKAREAESKLAAVASAGITNS